MTNAKLKTPLGFFLIIFLSVIYYLPALAQDLTEKSVHPDSKEGRRIIISTSGPAKFTSSWLDQPERLVIEFETKNVISRIGSELLVNEGVIKRITSEYYGDGQNKTLKSLTFELAEKTPYKIWQEENNIILDIQVSLGQPPLSEEGKEVFAKDESRKQILERLQSMEAALRRVSAAQTPIETAGLIAKTSPSKTRALRPVFWLMAAVIGSRTIALWLIAIALIASIGLLVWLFWRRYKLILDKNFAACEIAKLKTQLNEQNQLLEHEQVIRKTVESTSLRRENEFDHLKTEFQEEKQLLEQEQKARKTAEEGLSQKEKEVVEIKGSLESLKEVLVEKGIAKKLTTTEREGELWIAGKSPERRESTRLDLSKDYNRTIILRIESADKSKSIKSFANNIGLEGLCFETRHEFDEKEKISVRLFFFGDTVPILKIKAEIIWKKTGSPVNHYGVSFVLLDDKNKTELSRYIESKIATPAHI